MKIQGSQPLEPSESSPAHETAPLEKDPLDNTESSKPGISKPCAVNHHEVSTEDGMNLYPSAILAIRAGNLNDSGAVSSL